MCNVVSRFVQQKDIMTKTAVALKIPIQCCASNVNKIVNKINVSATVQFTRHKNEK